MSKRSKKKNSSNPRRSVVAAGVVLAGTAIAGIFFRSRRDRGRPHVGLYFEDGSMRSLPDSSPQATPLIELGREAIDAVRS